MLAAPGDLLQLLAVAGGALAWSLAAVVLRVSPRLWTSRLLAAVLLLEGGLQLATAVPDASRRALQLAADLGFITGITQLPWLYLLFLARLDTPLARPLRKARPMLLTAAGAYALLAVGAFGMLVAGREPARWMEPLFLLAFLAFGGASLYGLAVAVSAYRRAPLGTLVRKRARAFAFAFGARDGFVVAGIVAFLVEEAIAPNPGVHVPAATLVAIGTMLFVPLLAYGILRTQVLDIEARVRWTVSRGTVAIAFLAVFVAASQSVALLVAPRWGTAAGVVAAGALVLALVPIQRLADRIASRAVPDAASTTMLDSRRIEIYQAALEELAPGGEPRNEGDARYLASLRERLEITPRDHAVLARVLRSRAAAPAPAVLAPGARVLDRFQVERALGEGGEGRTFLAEDLQLQRAVVLKVLRASSAPEKALREARALAALRHPNVAVVHDVHLLGEETLMVIEHVEGGSLRDRLARGPLDDAAWRRLARDLLAALEAVHERGLVHGDVKPGNVLLALDGTAKLADFGLARLAEEDATRTTGAGAGTPRYMSPEQARGARASPLSDLYAAALTLAEARGGAEAFPEADPLAPWLDRALASSPPLRYQGAREMREALEAALAAAPSTGAQRS